MTIIDYGLGNIRAFVNVYERLNIPVAVARKGADLPAATKLILPGVGSFDSAMSKLNNSGMRGPIEDLVLGRQVPIIGVCVGMQILAKRSDEGILAGLGWIDAEVRKFDRGCLGQKRQLPHMGWNDVTRRREEGLFYNLGSGARFYFLHSYYLVPHDEELVQAVTDYSGPFASAVYQRNVYGVQFHPEKSHQWGIQLLKNFAQL